MQPNQKINALLDAQGPANQLLAIQLMQGQWGWSLEQALIYAFECYWKRSKEELVLDLGTTKVSYILEIKDDHNLPMGWDVDLYFELEHQKKTVHKEVVVWDNIEFEEDRVLNDYKSKVEAHFKEYLPLIVKYMST
ncbi:MAG: hypothetical protein GY810_16365 [Aureispira sp.]|nr:hypothetical protein [Aureispira sp.]